MLSNNGLEKFNAGSPIPILYLVLAQDCVFEKYTRKGVLRLLGYKYWFEATLTILPAWETLLSGWAGDEELELLVPLPPLKLLVPIDPRFPCWPVMQYCFT